MVPMPRPTGPNTVPSATVLTVATQHPWARMTDDSYFVDWFPYSVHAGRVNVNAADFSATWRFRALVVVGGLAAFAVSRRALASPDAK